MRYIGGKSKLAKEIAACLPEGRVYLEPFIGGGSVFALAAPNYEISAFGDTHEDLIMMYKALIEGWIPPDFVSEEQYAQLRNSKPSAFRGLVGFGSSFGGKWFGGYARGKTDKGISRNYLAETVRNLNKIIPSMKDSFIKLTPYCTWKPEKDWVVYCDPPYAQTQKFGGTEDFDSGLFWSMMSYWAGDLGAKVFVSEYSAPDDWRIVKEFNHRLSLTLPEQGREERVERLWTYK